MQSIAIFDLDETLINSSHRTPNKPDGTLDLDRYFEMKNRESIFKDSLLPLADVFRALDKLKTYIVICTARAMNQDDFDFLAAHNLQAHKVLCRPLDGSENHIPDAVLKTLKIGRLLNLRQFHGKPVVMFDDAAPVIRAIRKSGIPCVNAKTLNQRLLRR